MAAQCSKLASYIGCIGANTSNYSLILGGCCHIMCGSNSSAIIGGFKNCSYKSRRNAIIGGDNNQIRFGAREGNFIVGSSYSVIDDSVGSGIFGSQGSYILFGYGTFIFGDCNRTVLNASQTQYFYDISKVGGSFVIKHPNPEKEKTHNLIHYFVEAPTAGENIYRYEVTIENGVATKQLPGYFKFLNKNVSFKITGKDHFGIANAKLDETADNVLLTADTDGVYNLLIIGTRKDPGGISSWRGAERLKD